MVIEFKISALPFQTQIGDFNQWCIRHNLFCCKVFIDITIALTRRAMVSSTIRDNAKDDSPLDVSRAIAVVMILVNDIFPPTIITAPTSEIARPKPTVAS